MTMNEKEQKNTVGEHGDGMDSVPAVEPKAGGILRKIREMLVLPQSDSEDVMQKDDPNTRHRLLIWHRLLMGIVISYIGILAIVAVGFSYMLEYRMDEYDRRATTRLFTGENFTSLPPGEYQAYQMILSKVNEPVLREGDIVVLAGKDGGTVVSVKAPKDIDLPRDFYDQKCYIIKVHEDGAWEFVPTDHLDFMRKEMDLRKKMVEDYQKSKKTGEGTTEGQNYQP